MSVKTILIAHRSLTVRDRFAAALTDARHQYLLAGSEAALMAAVGSERNSVSLALVDLGLAAEREALSLVRHVRSGAGRPIPVVVFAGSVASVDLVVALGDAGVSGYVNEHADSPQILPALAPYLFPDNFNRRASVRVPVAIPVSFRAGQTIAAARTRDVGKGGIGVQTMEPLPAATPLQLTVRLPGAAADLSAFGRVIWCDRRLGMGIQFDRLAPDAEQHLLVFLNSKSKPGVVS